MTQRSIRRLQERPVDSHLIEFLVEMAGRAGSGGNRQPWRFIVVHDPEIRSQIGEWYAGGWQEYQDRGMARLPNRWQGR